MKHRFVFLATLAVGLAVGLSACSNLGIGISLPVGGLGHIGVSVDGGGRVGGQVGVGGARGSVSVGGTAQLPPAEVSRPASAASAASAAGG